MCNQLPDFPQLADARRPPIFTREAMTLDGIAAPNDDCVVGRLSDTPSDTSRFDVLLNSCGAVGSIVSMNDAVREVWSGFASRGCHDIHQA